MGDHPSEEQLEAACRAGDEEALGRARGFLTSAQAYTRGRAAEMLAAAPGAALAPLVAEVFGARFPAADWWRVVALHAEDRGALPDGQPTPARLDALLAAPAGRDPDALFQVLRLLAAARPPCSRRVALSLALHTDDEVALRAAMLLDDHGERLPPEVLVRLESVRGSDAVHALILRFRNGDAAAGERLVAAVPRSGPYAFHALDAIEDVGAPSLIPALRRLYRARFFVSTVVPRVAGAAAFLGDEQALERLRTLTASRRRSIRAVAAAELARTGTDADIEHVGAIVSNAAAGATAAAIVAELWRRDHPGTRSIIRAALSAPSAEIRAAACEAFGHLPATSDLRDLVERLESSDPDASVRRAATDSLAAAGADVAEPAFSATDHRP